MNSYRPQSQQQAYPPLQSRGFNPPPSRPPQQPPYAQASQPQAPSHVQQYQGHPQYHQQQRQAYYQQQAQPYAPQQQQHYAPQPHPVPPSTQVAPNQRFHPPSAHNQAYPSYSPSPSYPQPRPGPVVPPARARSQSPDKAGRPLPAPAAPLTPISRPVSMPPAPITSYQAQSQPQRSQYMPQATTYTQTHLPASSFLGHPTPQTFSQGRSFQAQPQAQPQPHTPPMQPHPQIPHSYSSPTIHTPPAAPARSPESTASKRPLPAPPSGGTTPSPPVVAASKPAVAALSAQRRTLPFSPTQSPSAQAVDNARRSAIGPPQRSSTLPTPSNVGEPIAKSIPASGTRDDGVRHSDPSNSKQSAHAPVSAPAFASQPSTFALPPQQRPTQSLAFRLAALSLREEQAQKQSPARPNRSAVPPQPNRSAASPRVRSMIDLDDAPPTSSIRRPSFESKPSVPTINVPGDERFSAPEAASMSMAKAPPMNAPDTSAVNTSETPSISASEAPLISISEAPSISVSEAPSISVSEAPSINVSEAPSIEVSEAPSISISEAPSITISDATPTIHTSSQSSSIPDIIVADLEGTLETSVGASAQKRRGLICYGCRHGILGRIVSAMGGRWHPACFKCTVCSELLEHVSSYEHAGKPYCHLDYHEKFAPQCYHCRTPIVDERFITLDDPALGKRTYHEQHFFCAECGDPFLTPTVPGKEPDEDSFAQDDDVGFTVYRGHPYCEACHVRLRYPKCKRCRKSIRDGAQAVEALGGKWCWECFLCAGCEKPFDDPAFFQRENRPYCEACFSVIIKSEL